MPLPGWLRALAPDDPRLRAVMLGAGLIPPRTMHTAAEAATLARLAAGARCVVELGVYEGSSARVLCGALHPGAQLHLVDPFVDPTGMSMRAGWHGTPAATRRAVNRRARRGGPVLHWHIARSQDVGARWTGPEIDLVFIDGDHSEEGAREDWESWHPHVRPDGAAAFHDARLGRPGGSGGIGPTTVVDALFRGVAPAGWRLEDEVDSLVVVRRSGD